ncbi:MAG TPA: branched-chain amino acid ABC transporter substrate-binding protein [Candidatus Nanopelagicales bacterium]|nr:branched-chain amino acid ABC transporter substrate-binding protein [Candidatus Nanopelagicales bacterium]
MKLRLLAPMCAGALMVASVLAAPAGAGGPSSGSAPIVVAVEAPLSGPQRANGRDMLRGVRLAARQANASGGVLGRRIKVVPVDDQANPNLAASVVDEALGAGAVAVIGPYNSAVGVINLPLYLDSGIVPVHMTSSNATDGLGITVQPKDDQLSPSEAAYVQSSGASSVAMLVDPSEFTQDMADRLAASLRADGIAVTEIPIAEGQSDYSAEVTQALALAPDLVYVSTYYPEGTKIAKALQARASDGPECLMGLANVDPAFVAAVDLETAQRCVFNGVPAAEQMPGARATKFVRNYERAFDTEPGVWGIFTYDSANVLFDAMEEVGSTAFKPVLKELDRIRGFAGATGEISINAQTGNRNVVPVYILEVDDTGTFVVADTN